MSIVEFHSHLYCTILTIVYIIVSISTVLMYIVQMVHSPTFCPAVIKLLKPSWPPRVEQTCTNCTVQHSTAQYYSKILQHNTTVQYYSTTITQIALIVPTVLLLNTTSTNIILILTLEYPILILALNYQGMIIRSSLGYQMISLQGGGVQHKIVYVILE